MRAVLTTEVIPWARGAVREIDIARRLMHHAVRHRTLPKGVDDRLLTVKDPVILEYDEAELRRLHAAVTDSELPDLRRPDHDHRVQRRAASCAAPTSRRSSPSSASRRPRHAFYLGRELAKAQLAITLGKTYRQEGALAWGYLTPPDDVRSEHVKLTQRRRRPDAARRAGAQG